MIIQPRTESVTVTEIDVASTFSLYQAKFGDSGSADDYYNFLTKPSVERRRFLFLLNESVVKADSESLIRLLSL
jgi:hypothetical protein